MLEMIGEGSFGRVYKGRKKYSAQVRNKEDFLQWKTGARRVVFIPTCVFMILSPSHLLGSMYLEGELLGCKIQHFLALKL